MYKITPIAALDSNYIWLLRPDANERHTYIVDPGDAGPVLEFLKHNSLTPAAILITHHHRDHIGGVEELLDHFKVPVFGPQSTRIPCIDQPVAAGHQISCGALRLEVVPVPGHTHEHISYFYKGDAAQPPFVFCGDALFAAGCGRRFEGDIHTMWASLQRLAALPAETLVYCSHEYTQANLAFALAMEPDNPEIPARIAQTLALRARKLPSLPSTIGVENRTNPFLRCQLPALALAVEQHTGQRLMEPAAVFGALRALKDTWNAT